MTRILVVEDEPSIALALEDDLRREGYEVDLAVDGEEACRLAGADRYDLYLLDIMLPKRDGFEVCRYLRSEGVKAPILMLTARGQESEKVIGLELGADDYVTKPYGPRELRARIKALLRRTSEAPAAVFRFGQFELDTARCELRAGATPVPLKPLEFRLLEFFLRNQGRVHTRQRLLDAVWGQDTHITERVVDNQVTNLRKKIESDPENPRHLISVRGIGYRFDTQSVTER
ncbi:MAG: response regulator transcription factor [Acidobacteria bacterium]|nr:response regulator transcription factor [Acidobacteriota bacterium]